VTGVLSPKAPSVVATPNPLGMAISADGKHAYIANGEANTISQFSIDPLTGTLQPLTPETVGTGRTPAGVALGLDGKSAYVTNSDDNTVSEYDVDPLTGALSPKPGAPVATGPAPSFGIAVGRFPMGNAQ
jgi:DNA-binding beta-propeller fold protein YncE